MELSLSEIEVVFRTRYGIEDRGSIAFRGRLQHLQRGGFPEGINTGKGRKAVYGWSQLIQISVALDLINLGFTPDVAKSAVLQNSNNLTMGAAIFAQGFTKEKLLRCVENESCPFNNRVFLMTSANSLFSLGRSESPTVTLDYISGVQLVESFEDKNPYNASSSVIDLSKRLLTMMKSSDLLLKREAHATIASFLEWTNSKIDEVLNDLNP